MVVSILVAAVVMFAVGAVWFTVLFGKTWSRLMNFTPEAMAKAKEAGMTSKMVMMFVLNVVSSSVLYYLMPGLLAESVGLFVCTVLIVWLGFTLPSVVNTYLWEGKSLKLVAINAGGSLAAFLAGSVVLYWLM